MYEYINVVDDYRIGSRHQSVDVICHIEEGPPPMLNLTHLEVARAERRESHGSGVIEEIEDYAEERFEDDVLFRAGIQHSDETREFLKSCGFSGISTIDSENILEGCKTVSPTES